MSARKPTQPAEAVKNVTSAGRSATLLAPAPNRRVPEVLATVVVVVAAAAAVVTVAEVATALSVVEVRRPGMPCPVLFSVLALT